MRFKIINILDKNKGQDAITQVFSVPFDTRLFDKVLEAFLTLSENRSDIDDMVTLVKRTDQSMFFNIKGEEEVLKTFFEKYYGDITWVEVKKKYGSRKKEVKFIDAIRNYFSDIKPEKITFNEETNTLKFFDIKDFEREEITRVLNSKKFIAFLEKNKFRLRGYKSPQEDVVTVKLDPIKV